MEGKKAIITGGSHGIGKGIVSTLASRGYDLVFSYNKREEDARNVLTNIQKMYEVKCSCLQSSFQDKEAGEIFFEKAVEILGGVDLFVNNAGTTRFENLLDITEEQVDYLISLDFRNYIMMMRTCARYMWKHKIRGSIVNVTSSRSERAYPGDGVYGACKAGIERAIQSFALDVAPYGIRINNVAPGAIQIYYGDEYPEKYKRLKDVYKQLPNRIPLGRIGKPEDVANAVAFLASDEASYITGITLRVDGGLILPGMPEDASDLQTPWGFFRK